MTANDELTHPLATHAGVRLISVSPVRVVVEQPALTVLDNHVGIRHASALYVAAWAASRALVLAALGVRDGAHREPRLGDSAIRYEQIPLGAITTVVQPTGGDWDRPDVPDARLRARAISANEHGTLVAALDTTWHVVEAGVRDRELHPAADT